MMFSFGEILTMCKNGKNASRYGAITTKKYALNFPGLSSLTYIFLSRVAKTYTKALETVVPRKATANLHRLYVNFAKFYEEGGVAGQAEPDLDSARKILEKAYQGEFQGRRGPSGSMVRMVGDGAASRVSISPSTLVSVSF